MVRSVGFGALAAILTGLVVGFWAALSNAPPEVTGGIASGLGGAFGLLAFGVSVAVRAFKRRKFPFYAGKRELTA
ncbi:MAG: hypothetical protein ACKVH0_11590 [Alphaproteobacteria bacterium]